MDNRAINMTPSYNPSYWNTPGTESLSPITLGQLVDTAAQTWGKREAIVSLYQGQRYTFEEIRDKAIKLAAGLLELGLKPGDRIGIWGPNSCEWYISRMAAAKGGFIAVQIEPLYQPPQLLYSLTKVEVKALICPDNSYYERLCVLIPELNTYEEKGTELNIKKIPSLKTLILISNKQHRGAYLLNDVMEYAKSEYIEKITEIQHMVQPDDGCNIQFSSGTTGFPKAVLLSHMALVNNAYFIGKWMRTETNDQRIVLPVQFCHASGTIAGIIGSLVNGSTVILPSPMFDARKTLEAIIKERGRWTFGTPSLLIDMVAIAAKENMKFPTLEVVSFGGAPCSQEVALNIKKVLGAKRLQPVYGMTEVGITFMSKPVDSLEKTITTVGCLSYHLEAKVVDKNGQMVPMGTPGELWLRGYSVLKEYWGDEEKTQQFKTSDGWAKTGDLCKLQDGGYASIVGRIKDVIIRIGDKIFPVELEQFFQAQPDVMEAQVFGIPDPRVGEEICVYLRLKEGSHLTEQDIRDYCKDKIPEYRIPRYIRFIDEFPRSAMGKVIKNKLVEALKDEIIPAEAQSFLN